MALATIDRADLAWLVGLYEGEGTCCRTFGPTGEPRLQMKISMTDLDVLERARDLTGLGRINGPYSRGPAHWKPQWAWMASGASAYALLVAMWGRLCERRRTEDQRGRV